MTRVLVAAASPVVRQGLEAIVTTSPLLTVVGTSGVATLAAEVETLQPDLETISKRRGEFERVE